MAGQDSENDCLVAGFSSDSLTLDLVSTGRGGMDAVVQVLLEQFESTAAVALFRVTAVDNRGNTVSYRTKLVHTIYLGPKMPVMKRATIGAYNKAFKEPFTFNLKTAPLSDVESLWNTKEQSTRLVFQP